MMSGKRWARSIVVGMTLLLSVPALVMAQCTTNLECSFPSGICQAGACLCDGQHTGASCADLTSGILHTLLQGGFWGICAISLVGGVLVGGAFRYISNRLQVQRETYNQKGLMFGYGDVDTYSSSRRNGRKKKRKKHKKDRKKKGDKGDDTNV